MVPTIRATTNTIQICNDHFGNRHHKSNTANAFRHALWNVLICKEAFEKTKNKEKALLWAQKVTTLYEKVTNNTDLDEAMDLHNNDIGRILFSLHPNKTEKEYLNILKEKMEVALRFESIPLKENAKGLLIYMLES